MAASRKGTEKLVDHRAWQLLAALQDDARSSLKELAAAAGLSIPATAERLRKLEEAGVIRWLPGRGRRHRGGLWRAGAGRHHDRAAAQAQVLEKIEASPEVLECHHVTGADSM